jgi:hypothetical protein
VEVPPRIKTRIARERVLVTMVFTGTRLLVLNVLLREQKFNQEHFLARIPL